MFVINPPPTYTAHLSVNVLFIICERMHKIQKTVFNLTSKSTFYFFNFYGLVKGKIQVLLRFYLSSTYEYYTTTLYLIIYYTILYSIRRCVI